WRDFSPWSHVVSLLYAQLTHSLGLNDVCDALRLHSGPLSALRGATAPPKNTLSHANRTRDPKMAQQLFWAVLNHLQTLQPAFGGNRRPKFAFRFKRLIHVVDATTIQLMARSLDWPNIVAAKPPQNVMSGWTSKLSFPAAPAWTPPPNTKPRGLASCAPISMRVKSSSSTRPMWTSAIWPTWRRAKSFGSPAPRTISSAASSASFRTSPRKTVSATT